MNQVTSTVQLSAFTIVQLRPEGAWGAGGPGHSRRQQASAEERAFRTAVTQRFFAPTSIDTLVLVADPGRVSIRIPSERISIAS